jgi:hypothetical protein
LPSRLRTWLWPLRATAAAASYAIAAASCAALVFFWCWEDWWSGELFVGWSGRVIDASQRVAWEGSRKMCRLDGQGSRRCCMQPVKRSKHDKRISGCCYVATCLYHTFQTSEELKKIQLCDWRKEIVQVLTVPGKCPKWIFLMLWLAPIIQEKGSSYGYC